MDIDIVYLDFIEALHTDHISYVSIELDARSNIVLTLNSGSLHIIARVVSIMDEHKLFGFLYKAPHGSSVLIISQG